MKPFTIQRTKSKHIWMHNALTLLVCMAGFSSCGKDSAPPPPSTEPKATKISVTIGEIGPIKVQELPLSSGLSVRINIQVDSLVHDEYLQSAGICWSSVNPTPTGAQMTSSIGTLVDRNKLPEQREVEFRCPFQMPGRTFYYRAYVATSKKAYYSEPKTYTVPDIATDDNCTEIPVVFHVLSAVTPQQVLAENLRSERFEPMIAQANLALRNLLLPQSGVGSDVHIRLVPATVDPQGKALVEPGMNPVQLKEQTIDPRRFLSRPTASELALIWDPYRYLNVWVFHFSDNYSTTAIAQGPLMPDEHPLSGLETGRYYDERPLDFMPGLMINRNLLNSVEAISVLSHELGHTLGLFHAFSYNACGDANDYCDDTPDYNHTAFRNTPGNTFESPRTGCDGSTFYSYNVMDYRGYGVIFSPDQIARMQQVLQYGYFTPGSETGRKRKPASTKAPQNLVRPTLQIFSCPAP